MFARALCSLFLVAPLLAHAGPTIEHWTLDNGARVYFVQTRELPMVQIRAVFDAASARDPRDKLGLARLTNAMLFEGAAGMNADEIAIRFENLGADVGVDAERDMATADLRSLTAPELLEPALDLFATVLTNPTFPTDSFARERQRTMIALARQAQSPGDVADKALMKVLYGDHPYAADPLGERATLERLTREDLVQHYRRYYVGRNLWLVMVGDLSTIEARRVSQKLVGKLPAGGQSSVLPQVSAPTAPRREQTVFPSSQSHILVAQLGIARDDPDFFPLVVGNHILGGSGLVSRLSNEVREKRGLSYSVYSYFSPMRAPGPFVLGLQTKNARRDEAVALLQTVLKDFIAGGPTEAELEAAKKNITGGFPLRLDSNRKIADQLTNIAYYGLPLTYLDEYSARVSAVTTAQIRDAFSRRVTPQRMQTVIVGGDS